MAIRTGPAELSQRLVVGLKRRGHRNKDGYVWKCGRCLDAPTCGEKCPGCQGTGLVPEDRVSVPDERKAKAVRDAVEGAVTPQCPSSILQRHEQTTLYLDASSASLLRNAVVS